MSTNILTADIDTLSGEHLEYRLRYDLIGKMMAEGKTAAEIDLEVHGITEEDRERERLEEEQLAAEERQEEIADTIQEIENLEQEIDHLSEVLFQTRQHLAVLRK